MRQRIGQHGHLQRVLVLRHQPLERGAVHLDRPCRDGAGQVAAAGGQQLEVVVLAAAAQLRDVGAQHALGQQVLEPGGQAPALGVEERVAHVGPEGGLRRGIARQHGQREHLRRRLGHHAGLGDEAAQVAVLEQLAPAAAGQGDFEDLDVHGLDLGAGGWGGRPSATAWPMRVTTGR